MSTPTIVCANSLTHLRTMSDDSIDAIITDPPYGLSATKPDKVNEAIGAWVSGDREHMPQGRGFMGADWDSFVPPPALWDECLRVLKPGGHLAAFAGARTYDLMGLSIRLSGFEIRDGLSWIYGSGMAHGQNIGKAVAKRSDESADAWQGWNTGLKPAQEPIVLARKPLSESTAVGNVLAHGTGAVNVDACRIEHRSQADMDESVGKNRHADYGTAPGRNRVYGDYSTVESKNYDGSQGRYPSNVILTHTSECQLVGQKSVKSDSHHPATRPSGGIGSTGHSGQSGLVERSPGTETVENWDCGAGCPVAEVDSQSGVSKSSGGIYGAGGKQGVAQNAGGLGDIGGASRFFLTTEASFVYSAKAGAKERPVVTRDDGETVRHVSVKPLKVMRWLVRLLTPPGGTILDPFAGSGTTVEAAMLEGFESIGIEKEADYVDLIQVRIDRHSQ